MSSGSDSGDEFAIEEEHENHERYLVTYADMITLLMALFVILYAMGGPAKEEEYNAFANGAREEIIHPLEGGIGIFAFGASEKPTDPISFARQKEPVEVGPSSATDLARELAGAGDGFKSTVDERGVVLTVPDGALLFAPGSSELLQPGRQFMATVAAILGGTTNTLQVEGHTDSSPLSDGSNWDLSSARASTVVESLIAGGVDAARLQAVGYADTRPVADNATAEGRRRNRRVEVVVHVQYESAAPDPIDLRPIVDPATG